MGRDVTEQTSCMEKLRTANFNLDLILNSIDDGVHGLDASGRTVFINSAARQMHGWPVADLQGKHAHDRIHGRKADGSVYQVQDCPIQATMRDGVRRRVSHDIFWRKDGSWFPVGYVAAAYRNEKGEIAGGLVIFRDISDRCGETPERSSGERIS